MISRRVKMWKRILSLSIILLAGCISMLQIRANYETKLLAAMNKKMTDDNQFATDYINITMRYMNISDPNQQFTKNRAIDNISPTNNNQQFTSATVKSNRLYAAPDPNVHYCKAYKWKETTGNETLDAEYDFFANVINKFADNGIQLLLNQGSLLGAARHFSFVPWDVQDVDFSVFSTDTAIIEKVLNGALQLRASRHNDGAGPGTTGFGYHVFTPFQRFIDLWLFGTINSTHSGCVGVNNGCKRWYTKYKWKNDEPPYFLTSDLACGHIPFGPYMFPSPYNTDGVLNQQFREKSDKSNACLNGE